MTVDHRDTYPTLVRALGIIQAATGQHGPDAERWARDHARRVLDALAAGAAEGDIIALESAHHGLPIGTCRVTVGAGTGDGPVDPGERAVFEALFAASLLALARGTVVLATPGVVQVWELAEQRLAPSSHTPALDGPGGAPLADVTYVPGAFALPSIA